MQVPWYRSLTAKLFILSGACILLATAGVATFNIQRFQEFLQQKVADDVRSQADKAATGATIVLDSMLAQVPPVMHTVTGVKQARRDDIVKNFLTSSRDYVALHIVRQAKGKLSTQAYQVTDLSDDVRMENTNVKSMTKRLRVVNLKWIQKLANQQKELSAHNLLNIERYTKLPLVNLSIPFTYENKNYVDWAVLTLWQTKLQAVLPNSQVESGAFFDPRGKVFVSALNDRAKVRGLEQIFANKVSFKGDEPAGIREINHLNNDYIAAWSELDRFGFTVAIARNARPELLYIRSQVTKTAAWALVFFLIAIGASYAMAQGLTRNLRQVMQATIQIASGNFNFRVEPKTRDEVAVLGLAVNDMSMRIVHLMQSQVEAARQEKELETARAVQSTLFPKGTISSGPLTVFGRCQPASECGGDWWGHFEIPDGRQYLFIADATGHGAPAALVTAMAYAGCQMISEIVTAAGRDVPPPSALLEHLNNVMWAAGQGTTTMTCFAAIIDNATGEMTYANGGHNIPYLLPENPGDERGKRKWKSKKTVSAGNEKRHIPIISRGAPIGMAEVAKFKDKQMQLKKGDKIVLFTDGIIECVNSTNEPWGKRTMEDTLNELIEQPAEGLLNGLFDRSFTHFADHPLDDDVTVVVAQVTGQWAPKSAPQSPDETDTAPNLKAAAEPDVDGDVDDESAA